MASTRFANGVAAALHWLARFLRRGALLRRFALTSFVVFVFLGVGIAYLLGRTIESDSLSEATSSAYDTLHGRLIKELRPSDLKSPLSGSRYSYFKQFVSSSVLSDRTVRVKIWNAENMIVFSSNERIIGQSFEHEPSLDQALHGSLVSNVPDLTNPENADDRGFGPLLQVYIPIRFSPHARVVGAFEIYQRYGPIQREIQQLQRRAYLFLGAGLLLLYALLFGIVRAGSRRIDSQQRELRRYTDELERNYKQTIESLAAAVDARDSSTEQHSKRVTELAVAFGDWMGFAKADLEALERGALLHDIGKIGVSDSILLKEGALTDREWAEMRKHPQVGYQMLRDISFLKSALPIVCFHHERWDGRGYPTGIAGSKIPLMARVFAVADAYDAVTSDRPYRPGASHSDAMTRIRAAAGTQFDPDVVREFDAMMASRVGSFGESPASESAQSNASHPAA